MLTPRPLVKRGPLMKTRYSDKNKITLTWSKDEQFGVDAIYHSSKPEFEECGSTLIKEAQVEVTEATFSRNHFPLRCYYHVKFNDGSVSSAFDRMIYTDGVLNFRDMGGYETVDGRTTRWGMLLRSADLTELSDADMQIVDELGISWICDLRSDFEVLKRPSPIIGKAINTNIPFMSHANPEEMLKVSHDMKAVYKAMILNTDKCSLILKELLREDRNTSLFHCAAGRDRTGVVCGLILLTLGVPRDVVIQDYNLTDLALEDIMQRVIANFEDSEQIEQLQKISKTDLINTNLLQAAFEAVDQNYGTFENYLSEGLGISEEDRLLLKNKYLI